MFGIGRLFEWFKGRKHKAIRDAMQDPAPLLKQVGAIMVSYSQNAFRRQAWGGESWRPRRVPNLFGILADFAAGRKKPAARRFSATPALRDTGRLSQSIAWQLISSRTVEVGTNVGYAGVHQRGGTTRSATLTPEVRKAFWAWLQTQPPAQRKAWKIGWVLNRQFAGQQIEGRVPARPFVGLNPEVRKLVVDSISENIKEV